MYIYIYILYLTRPSRHIVATKVGLISGLLRGEVRKRLQGSQPEQGLCSLNAMGEKWWFYMV